MAYACCCGCSSSMFSTPRLLTEIPNSNYIPSNRVIAKSRFSRFNVVVVRSVAAADAAEMKRKPTELVTFLGKGGAGKTTAAVIAAQYFAREGQKTCLVIHSQDPTAEQLIGCKIGTSPTVCSNNLSAIRLETSKMILEPLERVKKVDKRMNLTQGILDGVVGEELGVLPGMDSIFSALALQQLVNFLPGGRSWSKEEYDIVVYDGNSSDETLRLIGATERARWYVKYLRALAEKTDIGRLTSPSVLKLVYESIRLNNGSSEGKTSTEIWNDIEQALEKISVSFTNSSKFRSYLVMDLSRPISVSSALRYWGCAIQAGTQVSGAFGYAPESCPPSLEVSQKFSPLSFASLPYLSTESSTNWSATITSLDKDTKDILNARSYSLQSVILDKGEKSVTLFMPGFDKSEIKLYQYRGGSELLVEAGDQRRVIQLPPGMQGKVAGAKFVDRSLIVKLR